MNKQELEQAIQGAEDLRDRLLCDIQSVNIKLEELEKLAAKADESEPKKEWRQKPEIGEQYFWIQNTGEIACEYWHNDEFLDKELYRAGNCFPCSLFSREEVQQIAWRNQLNSLLAQYAIANGVLASKEEMEDNEKRLQWVSSSDCIGRSYKHYPAVALFNDEDVAIAAFCDVIDPFLAEHSDFVW